MAEDPHYYTRNIEVDHLVTRARQKSLLFQREERLSRIIRAKDVHTDQHKTCLIGGEAALDDQDSAPAVVIEKVGDRISRIIVTCPCGRHSELICEYDDEDGGKGPDAVDAEAAAMAPADPNEGAMAIRPENSSEVQ